ncbi:hypothetical protein GH733_018885 [Mirounga leonina]|nr:hypothetical protein GH733_018885 [Mirounga leonina]
MADEVMWEGEELWERGDAILVVELVLVVGDLMLVLQLAMFEGEDVEDGEDTEEEDEAREVEESEEEGEEGGEEGVAEDEAWTGDEEEEGEAEDAEKEEAEEVEVEPKEEEKPEEEEELEGAEEAEEEEGEEEAEKQAVEEEAEGEGAKEDAAEEDVSQGRQRLLEQRSTLIRGIRGFWAKAQFVNHPQMSAMMSEEDEGLLGYMTDLKVEELSIPRDGRKILLFFRDNPYFRNEVVVKEYVLSAAGNGPSHSTPIQWHQTYEQEAYSRRHHNPSPNFFNWFSDHSFAGSSRIAEIILDDLWPNPLQYYVRQKAPGEGTERRTGEGPRVWALKCAPWGRVGPGLHPWRP